MCHLVTAFSRARTILACMETTGGDRLVNETRLRDWRDPDFCPGGRSCISARTSSHLIRQIMLHNVFDATVSLNIVLYHPIEWLCSLVLQTDVMWKTCFPSTKEGEKTGRHGERWLAQGLQPAPASAGALSACFASNMLCLHVLYMTPCQMDLIYRVIQGDT